MGQSATLYRIAKEDILKIIDNPDAFDLEAIDKGNITFINTFEAIRFILSKNRTEKEIDIVEQIFYPDSHAGDAIDFNNVDIDNMPVDFDTDSNAVYYNDPIAVSSIAALLSTITEEQFISAYDALELNENEIYPGDNVWEDSAVSDSPFNGDYLAKEFKLLRVYFSEASLDGDYVLSFVG